jgi:hypothetical protein
VRSSIPVTGWAIDNIGIESVKIYRETTPGSSGNLIFIGDAVLVEGARPDIVAAYPDYPMNYKAGWGYMMLTHFLPNQGNGNFTLHAIASDKEGNETGLGGKTITCDNANAVKPFGAIDTPAQGGSAHGKAYVNFGWALTPQPNTIPVDGSTINVWVDGVPLGHPVYNQHRADIVAVFPGYNNSSGAVGYYYLDTTTYENGIHTIQWTVADNAGNTDGIGSRYFSIQNTDENRTRETVNVNTSQVPLDSFQPVRVKKGYADSKTQTVYPGDNGDIFIEIKELERLEIHFFDDENSTVSTAAPLPIGSTLDTKQGIFYWQPGPGFMGEHRLVFITRQGDNEMYRKQVTIDIRPRGRHSRPQWPYGPGKGK